MIDFSRLQAALADGRTTFASATPYPHIAIDDACDGMRLRAALNPIAQRLQQEMAASGDLIFARNKFVDTQFEAIAPELAAEVYGLDILALGVGLDICHS